ncbi:hypothetical protein BC332_29108 [Capsicum chinense]|nr:hypothetical protein BC332_29108 [Capsicum chinense]
MNSGSMMGHKRVEQMGERVPKRTFLGCQMPIVLLVGGNHTSSRFCTR